MEGGSPIKKVKLITSPVVPPREVSPPLTIEQEERNNDLYHLVFGIDLLREKILKYAIHENGAVSQENAFNCRLVQYAWMESVRKCLQRSGESLLKTKLVYNSNLPQSSAKNQEFIEGVASIYRMLKTIPPFSLNVDFYGDGEIPIKSIGDILQDIVPPHNTALANLQLAFYNKYFDVKTVEDARNPDLQTLHIWLKRSANWEVQNGILRDIATFFQLVSLGQRKQTHCRLSGNAVIRGDLSAAFHSLFLLETTTKLELGNGMEQFMMNNAFPHLTDLTLDMSETLHETISEILGRVRVTLKKLTIEDLSHRIWEWKNTPIEIPTMDNLDSLNMMLMNWISTKGINLGLSLPVLKDIILRRLTPLHLRGLVQNNRFESVDQISFSICNDTTANSHQDVTLSIAQLPRVFPQLSILKMFTYIRNDNPHIFQPIFQNMTGLRILDLTIPTMGDSAILNPHEFWSLMFLGKPPEEITPAARPDVTNLTELRHLFLNFIEADFNNKRISGKLPDAVFELGFLEMPKLVDASLEGYFVVSKDMANKFKSTGRSLMCQSM